MAAEALELKAVADILAAEADGQIIHQPDRCGSEYAVYRLGWRKTLRNVLVIKGAAWFLRLLF